MAQKSRKRRGDVLEAVAVKYEALAHMLRRASSAERATPELALSREAYESMYTETPPAANACQGELSAALNSAAWSEAIRKLRGAFVATVGFVALLDFLETQVSFQRRYCETEPWVRLYFPTGVCVESNTGACNGRLCTSGSMSGPPVDVIDAWTGDRWQFLFTGGASPFGSQKTSRLCALYRLRATSGLPSFVSNSMLNCILSMLFEMIWGQSLGGMIEREWYVDDPFDLRLANLIRALRMPLGDNWNLIGIILEHLGQYAYTESDSVAPVTMRVLEGNDNVFVDHKAFNISRDEHENDNDGET